MFVSYIPVNELMNVYCDLFNGNLTTISSARPVLDRETGSDAQRELVVETGEIEPASRSVQPRLRVQLGITPCLHQLVSFSIILFSKNR